MPMEAIQQVRSEKKIIIIINAECKNYPEIKESIISIKCLKSRKKFLVKSSLHINKNDAKSF